MTTVIQGCAVATVDGSGTEYADGHVVIDAVQWLPVKE